MAVTYNIKGTTNSSFKVGKQGTGILYAGSLEANNLQATGNLTVTGNLVVSGTTTTVNSTTIDVQNSLRFEGATNDAHETILTVTDPTADRTVTIPNATGTIVLQDTTDTLTNKTINSNNNTITITESNISDLGSYITASSSDTLSNKVLATLNVNNAYSFPTADGTSGQLLVTNGSGTLSFGSSGFPQDFGAISGSTTTFPIGTSPDFGAVASGENLIGPDFGEVNSNASSIFDDVTYTSTDTGSTAGPIIELYRNSASPADSDYLGQIKFQGENDTGGKKNYAKITGKILDASADSEDGILEFAFMKGGSNNISGRFRSDSLQLLNDTNLRVTGHTELGVVASDPSTTANFAHIYAKDESASAEVFVRDEAGNVTKISPHNEQGEWEYYSRNVNTGKVVRINMEEMIKDLEALTGKSYIKYE